MVFGAGDVWLTTRRIDGQFPNYKQLLPESFEVEVSTPRVPLLEVIRRAGVMAQRNAPLRLRFAEGDLSVSAQTQDVGEARESLQIDYAGEPVVVYGHTPVEEPAWQGNSVCIDTGCVFGGKLTALRWPEREIVSVPALKAYAPLRRGFGLPPPRPT